MKVLIVYHGWFGNTRKAAIAIAEGIERAGKVHVECQSVKQVKAEEGVSSDLLVFGSATHLGNMTGKMRGFIRQLSLFLHLRLRVR